MFKRFKTFKLFSVPSDDLNELNYFDDLNYLVATAGPNFHL